MTRSTPRLAKLTPPILPAVLTRARLFRVLDRARTRPLTWITAPAGFGKTTLVASYLKARRRPVCWYRLDEGAADPATYARCKTELARWAGRSASVELQALAQTIRSR